MTASSTPEPRSVCTPDRADLRGLPSSCVSAVSGELEVGRVPASSVTVRHEDTHRGVFRAELLDRMAVASFADPEAAIRWCGIELSWVHIQPIPGRTMLVGSDGNGQSCAVVTGPLLAVLPDVCKVEVR